MSLVAESVVLPKERLEVLFGELSALCGQRNAIDGRIAEIVGEIDRDGLGGMTGCRSIPALVAWKTGTSLRNAHTVAAMAARAAEFPQCVEGLRAGRSPRAPPTARMPIMRSWRRWRRSASCGRR